MKKKVISMLLIFSIILLGYNPIFAADTVTETGKDWLNLGEDNIPEGKGFFRKFDKLIGIDDKNNNEGFEGLAGVLMGLGTFIILIVGIILGIRLMFTQAEQKAKAKEALMIYLIGSVIIFGAVGIWKLLINILDGNFLY